jgi:hypothetical protein
VVFFSICFFCNFSNEIFISDQKSPLLKLDKHHKAYDIDISYDDFTFVENQETKTCYDFKRANMPAILNELTNTNWNLLFENLNVDSCIDRFYERLEDIFSQFIPTIRLNSKSTKKQPWQTRQLKNLRNRKTKEHKRSSGNCNRRYYEALRTEYTIQNTEYILNRASGMKSETVEAAILSCFAKLLEVIIYSHMFFSVKSIITPHQHGFLAEDQQ